MMGEGRTAERNEDELTLIGQLMPRNRASQLQFPQITSGRSSLALHSLRAAGFGSLKANNLTQFKTKLFNLDLPQLDFFFLSFFFPFLFLKCKIEIKNYSNCYAHIISTGVENSHPALEPNWEHVPHAAFAYKKRMNFPLSYQEMLTKYPLWEYKHPAGFLQKPQH